MSVIVLWIVEEEKDLDTDGAKTDIPYSSHVGYPHCRRGLRERAPVATAARGNERLCFAPSREILFPVSYLFVTAPPPSQHARLVTNNSSRKVARILEEMGGFSVSASTVSKVAAELDEQLKAFRQRRLDDCAWPFVIVDARVERVRRNGRVWA